MKLSQIPGLKIRAGYPFRGKVPVDRKGDSRVVQMKDVDPVQGITEENINHIFLTGKKDPDWIRKGDILFVSRGHYNFSVLVDREYSKMVAAPQFFLLTADRNVVNPVYLAWSLNHHPSKNHFSKMAQDTSLPNITRTALESCPFQLPPLEVQEKLVNMIILGRKEKELYESIRQKKEELLNGMIDQILRKTNDTESTTKLTD